MNRTSKSIKMLMLLSERGKMNCKELAQALDTNPRNIREFKKELVNAGFLVKYTIGYYGGYELEGVKLTINKA